MADLCDKCKQMIIDDHNKCNCGQEHLDCKQAKEDNEIELLTKMSNSFEHNKKAQRELTKLTIKKMDKIIKDLHC